MPELPEVEVTRAAIAMPLQGARIAAVRVGKPLRWPLGQDERALAGLQAGAMSRRGKYLWLPLAREGEAAGGLLWHLGMSGSLGLIPADRPPGPHDHFDLVTERGTLRLTDPRRFGAVVWSPAVDQGLAGRLLATLGREPFDPALTPAVLRAALRERRAPIKAVLLAGDIVVGAGNIYACEALFLAGIDPRTPAHRLGPQRCARMLEALRLVLQAAITSGGSTLRDFRDPHGAAGDYQSQRRVYDRAGERCQRCGGTIRRLVMGQRSTYFCPGCQRR